MQRLGERIFRVQQPCGTLQVRLRASLGYDGSHGTPSTDISRAAARQPQPPRLGCTDALTPD